MRPRSLPATAVRSVFALGWLLAAGATACSSSAPEPATPAEAAGGPQYGQQQQPGQYPPAGYPQATAAPSVEYATPAAAISELDLAEKALDGAIQGHDAAGQPLAAGVDRCITVCDALASMRRSAEHVCQLDTSRCDDARGRVQRAEERARAACPACTTAG